MDSLSIFVTWSGESSKAIGRSLCAWLEHTLQRIKPIYSPSYVMAGRRTSAKLYNILENVNTAILVYTSEGISCQRMIFEAGNLRDLISIAQ